MPKAISCISGTSNAASIISPLNLLQGRLCVNQKLGGESIICLLPFYGRAVPEAPGEEAARRGAHTVSGHTISAVEDLRTSHFLLQTLVGCEG